MHTIAHLSDTHFGGHPDAVERAAVLLDHVAAFDPPADVVLVTGDIADHGLPEEYDQAEKVLGSWPGPAPLLVCPGNHDVRAAYAAWRGLPPDRPADTATEAAGALFVMLDSLVPAPPGERIDHGVLAEESLAFLDDRLAARPPGRPAYLCLHHPPADLHVSLMDPIRLRNADALAQVLGRHRGVRAVLVGHAHTACATTFAGLPLLVGGGSVSTVTLDAEPLPVLDYDQPPMLAVHLVADDGRVVTHWRALNGAVR